MRVKVTAAAGSYPITLDTAKDHLHITHSDEDSYIELLIAVATEAAEVFLNRSLITQTITVYFDEFPVDRKLEIPRAPASAVNFVKYLDTDGAEQTLAAAKYSTDFISEPARIELLPSESWPATQNVINAVWLEAVAGYGAAEAVPEMIKHGILLHVHDLYENRGEVAIVPGSAAVEVPRGIKALLWPYKLIRL